MIKTRGEAALCCHYAASKEGRRREGEEGGTEEGGEGGTEEWKDSHLEPPPFVLKDIDSSNFKISFSFCKLQITLITLEIT